MPQATREPWDASLLYWRVDVLVLEEEWSHLPGDYSKENLAFDVEERDWARGAHSNGALLLGYPDPISQAPFLCEVSFPPGSLWKANELFQDSWAILVELEEDTIQPWGAAGTGFANKLPGLIQPESTCSERVSGSSNGGMPSIVGSGTSFRGSEYVFLRWSSSSCWGMSSRPILVAVKSFLEIPVEGFPGFTLLFPPLPVVFSSGED